MCRLFAAAAAVASCAGLAACTVSVGSDRTHLRDERHFKVGAAPRLDLTTFDGSVEVRAWDRQEVRVEIERYGSSREAAEAVSIVATQDGDHVTVEARPPSGGRWGMNSLAHISNGAKLVAHVPSSCDLTVKSGDGSLSVERLTGHIDLTTSDGSIRGVELDGDVSVDTGDGSVKLERMAGALRVRTGDGSVWLGGRLTGVDVFTNDGTVALKLEPGSEVERDWEVSTGGGGIVVHLPDDLRAELDAATGDGSIRVEHHLNLREASRTRQSLRATLGEGGREIRLRTADGSIAFHKF